MIRFLLLSYSISFFVFCLFVVFLEKNGGKSVCFLMFVEKDYPVGGTKLSRLAGDPELAKLRGLPCYICHQPIEDEQLKTNTGKALHPACFHCHYCEIDLRKGALWNDLGTYALELSKALVH